MCFNFTVVNLDVYNNSHFICSQLDIVTNKNKTKVPIILVIKRNIVLVFLNTGDSRENQLPWLPLDNMIFKGIYCKDIINFVNTETLFFNVVKWNYKFTRISKLNSYNSWFKKGQNCDIVLLFHRKNPSIWK